MGRLKTQNSKPRIKGKRFLFFLLFSVHYLLFTAVYADEILSRSALVMDADSERILFAKNPHLKLPPASTVKVMTAIVVAENADLEKIVTVSSKAAWQQPSKINLKRGERIKIKDLLYAALMESANDAATALAESVTGNEWKFVKLMNQKALEIGATNTRFINANGLPGKRQYTTAYDLAKIMQYAIRIPLIREVLTTRFKEISTVEGRSIFMRNANKLLWKNEDFVGGKTGFTRRARHCLVGVTNKENRELVVSVLGSPSRQLLWSEYEALFEKGFNILNMQEEPVIYTTKVVRKEDIKQVNTKRITSKNNRKGKYLKTVNKKVSKGIRIARGRGYKNI